MPRRFGQVLARGRRKSENRKEGKRKHWNADERWQKPMHAEKALWTIPRQETLFSPNANLGALCCAQVEREVSDKPLPGAA